MSSFIKKASFTFLVLLYSFTLLLSTFTPHAAAATPWYNPPPEEFGQKVTADPQDAIFGERYTYAQVVWILDSLYLILNPTAGLDESSEIIDFLRQLLSQESPSLQNYAALGIPGLAMAGISGIYTNLPASGIEDISNSLAKFSIASPAHAQGYGFTSLSAINRLWATSRNIVYLLMIVILVAAAFMIMFRVKINPQTAISVQLMIPKIIITLLLVTFSYAIAGLVLDSIFVIITLVLGALSYSGVFGAAFMGSSIRFFATGGFAVVLAYYMLPFILVSAAGGFSIFIPLLNFILPVLTLISIVLIVLISWLLLRVFWMLLKTYLTLMFLIIVGPWQIMLGLLPGNQGFGAWFRNLIANAAVFVVVPLMLLLNMLFWQPLCSLIPFPAPIRTIIDAILAAFSGTTWRLTPLGCTVNTGLTTSGWPSLPFVGTVGFLFSFVMGYAILALIPKAAEMVRDALKAPQFKYGTAIGQALGPAFLLPSKGVGLGASSLEYAAGQIGAGGLPADKQAASSLESAAKAARSFSNTISGWGKKAGS